MKRCANTLQAINMPEESLDDVLLREAERMLDWMIGTAACGNPQQLEAQQLWRRIRDRNERRR
jgi:hypothetical protein